jgi:malic enzyme
LLDTRSKKVDYTMLVSIANAIASLVDQSQLKEDYILPKLNDLRLTSRITRTPIELSRMRMRIEIRTKCEKNRTG